MADKCGGRIASVEWMRVVFCFFIILGHLCTAAPAVREACKTLFHSSRNLFSGFGIGVECFLLSADSFCTAVWTRVRKKPQIL